MLLKELLVYVTIPLTTIFVRGTLQKWGITDKMLKAKFSALFMLGYCELCFYTWCNFFISLAYSFAVKDYYFLLYTPALTIISMIVSFYLDAFDNGE
jgi:hypothetical protein